MNYLAHLFLAEPTAESLLGNLAGDFVKGRLDDRFTAAVRRGITEHRRVDEFTDTHPSVAAFRRVVGETHRHYSRVITDMFFDYYLSQNWDDYSNEPLEDFLHRVFATLDPMVDRMPGDLSRVYPRMRDGRWLQSYADPDGIRMALRGISQRFSRAPRLEDATALLTVANTVLLAHFREFFPDVMSFVKTIRSSS